MYKKILVVVDDRVVTQSAIRQAIEMAHALRADIHFFYVLPDHGVLGLNLLPVAGISTEDVQNEEITHAQKILAAASELAERAGVQSFRATGSGPDGAQCVSDAAEKKHCELIVVGTEGKNAVLSILTGSIVSRLISVASIPVLVCRDTGSRGIFSRKASASVRVRRTRMETEDRHRKERND